MSTTYRMDAAELLTLRMPVAAKSETRVWYVTDRALDERGNARATLVALPPSLALTARKLAAQGEELADAIDMLYGGVDHGLPNESSYFARRTVGVLHAGDHAASRHASRYALRSLAATLSTQQRIVSLSSATQKVLGTGFSPADIVDEDLIEIDSVDSRVRHA